VQEVWPLAELKSKALKLAEDLAAQPVQSVKGMLETIVGCEDKSLQDLLKAERWAVLNSLNTPDSREGMAAFIEKRRPMFNKGGD
jgi:enoyl-CoA hydratase